MKDAEPLFQDLPLEQLEEIQNHIQKMIQAKKPQSTKITITTSPNYSHEGYLRKDGRSIIYERRVEVENQLARYNYTIPHEGKKGVKAFKSDAFFNSKAYGGQISRAWNYLYENKSKKKKENQLEINKFFTPWN